MTQTRTYNISITVTVDDEDAELLHVLERQYASGQMTKQAIRAAVNNVTSGGYKGMHRAILARQGLTYGKGMVADHINNEPGDNTRHNLRIVTHRQNNLTGGRTGLRQSIYNGVSWNRKMAMWTSVHTSRHNGKQKTKRLGYFKNEETAAKAYDAYLQANNIKKPLNFPEVMHEASNQASG